MSLVPLLFSDWWEELDRPQRLLDQHFGQSLSHDDLPSSPYGSEILVLRPCRRRALERYRPYDRTFARKSRASTVQADKDKFEVALDVQQFGPEEVTVKLVGKNVVVEGKHEERQDEHGWISRQFVRKYLVPEQCDIDGVKTNLSSDGILTVTAPRKEPVSEKSNERIVKIEQTGKPALRAEKEKTVEDKEAQGAKVQTNSPPERGEEKTVKAA